MPKRLPHLPPQASFTRRRLPHLDIPGVPTFVTFRLFNTIPQAVRQSIIDQVEQWRQIYSASDIEANKRLTRHLDQYLDKAAAAQAGPCYLRQKECCAIFEKHLSCGAADQRYLIHAYCIMPNHVHLLMETLPKISVPVTEISWSGSGARKRFVEAQIENGKSTHCSVEYWTLSKIMRGLKSYSAMELNKYLGRSGAFWQDESFDHVVRDEAGYSRVIDYIENNPVNAGLCHTPEEWLFSSAGKREGG
jgi:putative DNA methylase